MNAMQKVAWLEVVVALSALATVTILYPWFGNGATAGFGLLGLLGVGAWFARKRKGAVVTDERDAEIARKATILGFGAAWQTCFLALIALVFWSSLANENSVPTVLLTWLVWVQLAIAYLVKGAVGVVEYRRQADAA